ncbi:MAG: BrnT family toxin [Cyanobacteria bacterium FC1]|nr:BrnT family toxin [Cyanobacteria bacterium FC1]
MEYERDEAKRLANLRKHGIDFIDVPAIFDGDILIVEDDRYSYGEQRLIAFGLLQGRANCTCIISARKATKYEQRVYFEQLSN